MADTHFYIRNDGSNTSPYDTWAKASTTVGPAFALATASAEAGNTAHLWVDDGFTESITALTTWSGVAHAGHILTRLLSVDSTGNPEPPTAANLSAGATITVTASTALRLQNSMYVNGVYLLASGASNSDIHIGYPGSNTDILQVFENSKIDNQATGATADIALSNANNYDGAVALYLKNTDIGAAKNSINVTGCEVYWCGGTLLRIPSASTGVFANGSSDRRGSRLVINGVDASVVTTGKYLLNNSGGDPLFMETENVSLGAGGGYVDGSSTTGGFLGTKRFYNVQSGNSPVQLAEQNSFGQALTDTGIYRTANGGSPPYSVKVITTALSAAYTKPFRIKLATFIADTTSATTFAVEIAQDGTTTPLKDNQVWIEVEYPRASSAQSVWVDDRAATILTTPADQTTSAEGWTGLSGTNVKQKLSVTTSVAGRVGPVAVWLNVASPSLTLYACPDVVVS